MRFEDLAPGDKFEYAGIVYEKITAVVLCGYGYVNCVGPSKHDGDSGHRFVPGHMIVETV